MVTSGLWGGKLKGLVFEEWSFGYTPRKLATIASSPILLRPAASEILQWDPTAWHGLQIENDVLEKWSRRRVYTKQSSIHHLACIIALLQCQREPS